MRVPSSLVQPCLSLRQAGLSTSGAGAKGLTGPAVRLLLLQYGINEGSVTGTGPKKNLLKNDVVKYIESSKLKPVAVDTRSGAAAIGIPSAAQVVSAAPPKPVPKPGERFVDIPLSNMRKTIAKRLLASKQSIPHAYATATVDAGRVGALRERLRGEGVRASVNDFIIKATASALRAVPAVNVQYINGEVHAQNTIDVSVAVATQAGLITPIIFNADRLGVVAIGDKVRELAAKAKANTLQPPEFQGGTFTVSNLGMFGSVSSFTAIINPPQAAILAIGGTQHAMKEDGKPESTISVSLCYDSRAITELDAKHFLEHFRLAIEQPELMLVDTGALHDTSALL